MYYFVIINYCKLIINYARLTIDLYYKIYEILLKFKRNFMNRA